MVETTRASWRSWVALIVLTVSVTILSIDNTVLSLAMPALSEALSPTSVQMLWIGDIYAFMLAGFLVTGGNLADYHGRRRILLIGLTAFGVFSAGAAWAPSSAFLIVIRALLGVFAAFIMPATLALVRTIFLNDAQRTLAVAIWSAGSTGGMALGPAVGGFLLEHVWWGSVFLINTPIMAFTIVGVLLFVPESRSEHQRRVDYLSAVLSVCAMIALIFSIKEFARLGFTVRASIFLVLGVVLLVVFIRRQSTIDNPILDLSLFREKSFSWALFVSMTAIFAFSGLFFFFGQYLQLVRGFSPLKAGGIEIAAMVFAALSVVVLPSLVRSVGQGKALSIALGFMSVGFVAVAITEDWSHFAGFAVALALIGFGAGVAYPVATDVLLATAPAERAGSASSVSQTAYQLGTALGIGVLGSVVSWIYRARLVLPEGYEDIEDSVRDSLASAAKYMNGDPAMAQMYDQARQAFSFAMQATSLIAAFLLFLALLIAWFKIPAQRQQG